MCFWLVWADDGGNPTHKHDTEKSARNEAARLARQFPGTTFHVLELLGSVVKSDLAWTAASKHDGPSGPESDDIPF